MIWTRFTSIHQRVREKISSQDLDLASPKVRGLFLRISPDRAARRKCVFEEEEFLEMFRTLEVAELKLLSQESTQFLDKETARIERVLEAAKIAFDLATNFKIDIELGAQIVALAFGEDEDFLHRRAMAWEEEFVNATSTISRSLQIVLKSRH